VRARGDSWVAWNWHAGVHGAVAPTGQTGSGGVSRQNDGGKMACSR
jgi:hypothetical protein